jgi:hypothetical protein
MQACSARSHRWSPFRQCEPFGAAVGRGMGRASLSSLERWSPCACPSSCWSRSFSATPRAVLYRYRRCSPSGDGLCPQARRQSDNLVPLHSCIAEARRGDCMGGARLPNRSGIRTPLRHHRQTATSRPSPAPPARLSQLYLANRSLPPSWWQARSRLVLISSSMMGGSVAKVAGPL